MHHPTNPFRLNVGFFINQPVGYSRDINFDIPHYHLQPDLNLNNISGSAQITRTAQGLLIVTDLSATVLAECVRCLTAIQQSLNMDFTELYAFSRKSVADPEFILPEDAHINLEPLIREYMLLEIPISPLCKTECKGLCSTCGENLNETVCEHNSEAIDPRMAVLKSLIKK